MVIGKRTWFFRLFCWGTNHAIFRMFSFHLISCHFDDRRWTIWRTSDSLTLVGWLDWFEAFSQNTSLLITKPLICYTTFANDILIFGCEHWALFHNSVCKFLILFELLINWAFQVNILSHWVGHWCNCRCGFSQNRAINLACKRALFTEFADLNRLRVYAHDFLLAHFLELSISLKVLSFLLLSCADISFLNLLSLLIELLTLVLFQVCSYCIYFLCKTRHG